MKNELDSIFKKFKNHIKKENQDWIKYKSNSGPLYKMSTSNDFEINEIENLMKKKVYEWKSKYKFPADVKYYLKNYNPSFEINEIQIYGIAEIINFLSDIPDWKNNLMSDFTSYKPGHGVISHVRYGGFCIAKYWDNYFFFVSFEDRKVYGYDWNWDCNYTIANNIPSFFKKIISNTLEFHTDN